MKKTDAVNYNATMNYSNKLLNSNLKNDSKRMNLKALGLILKICLKTGIRVSDILNLEYSQFTENKMHPNTYTLEYSIEKTKSNNTVPIGHELKYSIDVYKMECLSTYGYTSDKIFFNYQSKKIYSRVWVSKKVALANKNGNLGQVVNTAGIHSIRKTAVLNLFNKTQDLKLAQSFLGHKNILTTSIYLQDSVKSTQDKLRENLC